MKKYYLGFLVLTVLTVFATIYTLAQGEAGKKDEETAKKVEKIAPELDEYIYQENKIPQSLDAAGIKDVPSTITYTKLDEERFKFCATFQRASGSFDAGPFAFLTGLAFRAPEPEDDSGEERTYFDYYTLSYFHKKGENCQTVKPMLQTEYDYQTDSIYLDEQPSSLQ